MKRISGWLIFAGILLILIPLVGSFYGKYQQDKIYEAYLEQQEGLNQNLADIDAAFKDEGQTTESTPNNQEPAPKDTYQPTVIGKIKIAKIDLDLLLVEGTTANDMRWGAGHMPASVLPGQKGNCAIAGHRNYTFGKFFSRLDEVKSGDVVTIEYKSKTYKYQVYEKLIVEPSDTSVLKKKGDEKTLTLITCHPKGSTKQRLILHAKAMG